MSQTSFFGIFKSRNNTSNGTFYKEALYNTLNHNVQKHQCYVSTDQALLRSFHQIEQVNTIHAWHVILCKLQISKYDF